MSSAASSSSIPTAAAEIQRYLSENKAVLFGTSTCPYCKKLKNILMKYHVEGLKVVEIDLLNYVPPVPVPAAAGAAAPVAAAAPQHPSEADFRAAMKELTGATSVPRFFIAGKFIGGCDDVTALDNDGKFEPMLAAAGVISTKGRMNPQILTLRTSIPFDTVVENAGVIVAKYKYGMLHKYDLTKILQSKGQVSFKQPVAVLEVCNPKHAAQVLSTNVDVSNALPCRISVWADLEHNETVIQTVRPTIMIGMFQTPELNDLANEVQTDLYSIMHGMA